MRVFFLFFFIIISLWSAPYHIHLVSEDEYHVNELISKLAKKNLAQLLYHSRHMYSLGNKVEHIHPLQFFGFILKDPYLKECLREIKTDSIKWWNFMRGFSRRMKDEIVKPGFYEEHVCSFAETFRKDPKTSWTYLSSENFEEFITYYLE